MNTTTPPPLPSFAPPALNYQTPAAYEASAIWAQGNRVMANDCTVFPPRCIGCNGNDGLKMAPRILTWAPSYAYFALLLGLLPGAIIVLLSQRKVKVKMATCAGCRRKVLKHQLITVAIILAAFVAFWAGAVLHKYFALAGLAILLAGIVYGIVATRLFSIANIKKDTVTLKGLGSDFIGSLDQR